MLLIRDTNDCNTLVFYTDESLFSAMHGSLVTSSLLAETHGDEILIELYRTVPQ